MSNYDPTNRGAIWTNQNRKSEKHPTHSGSINIEGVEYWISGWATAKDQRTERSPVMSFSVTRKEDKPSQSYQGNTPQGTTAGGAQPDFEDDILFSNYELRTLV